MTSKSTVRIALVVLVSLAGCQRSEIDFQPALRDRLNVYVPVFTDKSINQPMLEGRFDEIVDRLETLVPDSEKTGVDHFVIGKILYRLDPERSFEHHARALKMLPKEPQVKLQMAHQYQRRGDCQKAEPLYRDMADKGYLHTQHYALLAHCQLVLGQYGAALKSWERADHTRGQDAIDNAIHEVFAGISAQGRHHQLVARVQARDESAIGELFSNALDWKWDWWNAKRNMEAFDAGVKVVRDAFGPESEIGREVALYARGVAKGEIKDVNEFTAMLRQEKFLLDGGRLPRSSYIAKEWIHWLLRAKVATVKDFQRFLPELQKRAAGGKDEAALEGALVLVAGPGNEAKRDELYRLGWEVYKNPRFALRLLAGRDQTQEAISAEDPMLRQAIRDFPHVPAIQRAALAITERSTRYNPEDVARLIDAEYHGLESDPKRRSGFLDQYYTELARQIEIKAAGKAG